MSTSPSAAKKLRVVLYWHMHQPQYQTQRDQIYTRPWTYLHGIKDYVDMAIYLERHADAKAVFNFTPILLEQIRDYSCQLDDYLKLGTPLRDPLLAALHDPENACKSPQALAIVEQCLKANEKHFIGRFEDYGTLVSIAKSLLRTREAKHYLNPQFMSDLLTWYHLAWFAEISREEDGRLRALIEKASGYTRDDRQSLLMAIGEQISSIIPRYRKLRKNGQIELSLSPYAHPILPLLLDFKSGRDALPDMPLPESKAYPGGEERSLWHMQEALALFEECFGFKPTGCWPSEGAVCEHTLRLLNSMDFKWAASGQQVLENSLKKSHTKVTSRNHPFKLPDQDIRCFFRDDNLSDMIGFTYQDWHGDDAVNNMVYQLEQIAKKQKDESEQVVSIILDGENCWEYYPNNGYYFLTGLYEKLAHHPHLQLTTYSECIENNIKAVNLSKLCSGSWVYGTLSTWIGDKDKNKAWDALVEAKRVFDQCLASGKLDERHRELAVRQLAICEGSDWFWWFGDYNPAESVSDFESLFREHLSNLYRLLGEEVPEHLKHVMSQGQGSPENAGVMRRGQQ